MSFQGIEAGKAFVEFLIKDDKLDSGLLKVGDKLKKFGSIGLAASGPVIAAFAACATVFASTGSALQDMSDRTGISAESLSLLSFAADQTGTDLGAVEKAAKELQKNGIDPVNFESMLGDLAAIPDKTQRAQRALDLFGKRGVELVPMIEQFANLREEFQRLHIGMSTDEVAAADRLGDAWGASKAQFIGLMQQIGAAIAGPLTDFLTWSQGVVASVIDFVHANPLMVRGIAVIATAIAAASAALLTFGTLLTIVTLHPIVAFLSLVAGAVVAIAGAFGLASSSGDGFNKKLDAISSPRSSRTTTVQQQAANVQRQMQTASMGGTVAFNSPITPQVSQTANADSVGKLTSINADQLATLKLILEVLKVQAGPAGLLVAGF